MQIGRPLRTVVVEPLELPVREPQEPSEPSAPAPDPEPEPDPRTFPQPEPEQVPAEP